jgi:gluconolactonase
MSSIVSNKRLEQVFSGGVFTEGPASDRRGNILFSDCSENIIYSFNEFTKLTSKWSTNSGHANGMNFDHKGRLVVCCDGKKYDSSGKAGERAVRRYESDGSITTLADTYSGKKLNSPNDLCFDSRGSIYFTDPRYGEKADLEQDVMAVYRIDEQGNIFRIISDLETPNGILISRDDKNLFIVDHNPEPGGARILAKYRNTRDEIWEKDSILFDLGTEYGMDGMVLDSDENIYVTGGSGESAGVHIVSNAGVYLDFIPTPEVPGNCTFGGEKLDILYICATTSLYRIHLNTRGFLAWM